MSPKPGQPGKPAICLLPASIVMLGLIAALGLFGLFGQPNAQTPQSSFRDQVNRNAPTASTPSAMITAIAHVVSSKSAWVNTRVLTVQMWPGEGHPALAEVVRGEEVRIVRESDDGEWSLLSQPVQGWIRNEHLRYTEKYISPRLTPTSFRTFRWVKADPRLRVRTDPDTDSDIVTHIAHGELLEIDEFTEDMRWAHIIAPTEGWTSTRYLSLTPTNE